MARKMQVWGTIVSGRLGEYYGQLRVIVAVPSRAAAVRALNAVGYRVSDGFMRDYGGTTGNETEVALATSQPGVVFALPQQDRYRGGRRNYVAVSEVKSHG